jgi:hypothetical protein
VIIDVSNVVTLTEKNKQTHKNIYIINMSSDNNSGDYVDFLVVKPVIRDKVSEILKIFNMAVDFISLGNIIFKDKDKYKFITDDDKDKNFFILNRKFAYKEIRKAHFFNFKSVDKASSLDVWFEFFCKTTAIPKWYWQTKMKKSKKVKSKFKKLDLDDIKDRYDISESDVDFLSLYYEDEISKTIKRVKKFDKK